MRKLKNICTLFGTVVLMTFLGGCGKEADDTLVLRVANWEEYIDQGDWDEEETIELADGTEIIGEQGIVDDFTEWYLEEYGKEIKVEYSTFGTNEDLLNQLSIGDEFDLVCPSEYTIMKMMREDMLVPFDDSFYDASIPNNYYAKGVSPYIRQSFEDLSIEGESISKYAAGYMWGTMGMVYNPELVDKEAAEHWNILTNRDYERRITIKDSVREAYFAAIAIDKYDEITTPDFIAAPDYHERLFEVLNETDDKTIADIQRILTDCKNNVYSFETDSGKSDMVTGKVVANEQWSGDAVYTLDLAEEDDVYLNFAVPTEGSNLWFDGWVILKNENEDAELAREKKEAAQAFINFVSRPDNAIRNMYYIGYTSVISGGDSDLIYQYIDYNYGVEEGDEYVEYPLGYFFKDDSEEANEEYMIYTYEEQLDRQLYAQYPPKDVIDRSAIMKCFDDEDNVKINRMWTNVRCFDLSGFFDKWK